jgi:hypothetical protein
MAPSKQASVVDLISNLDEKTAEQVQLLRGIILSLGTPLTEHVKWNAPSYVLDGEDRITMNLRNKQGIVKLVLHMGVVRPEDKTGAPVLPHDGGIVDWASDIRGLIPFVDAADIREKEQVLRRVVTDWLALDHRASGS